MQFYVDTVKQMALHQLVAGSPLRTLCLLIAGQPAEVFSTGTTVDSMDMSQQHAQVICWCMKFNSKGYFYQKEGKMPTERVTVLRQLI